MNRFMVWLRFMVWPRSMVWSRFMVWPEKLAGSIEERTWKRVEKSVKWVRDKWKKGPVLFLTWTAFLWVVVLIFFVVFFYGHGFSVTLFDVNVNVDARVAFWLGTDEKKDILSVLGLTAGGLIVLLNALALFERASALNKTAEANLQANEQALQANEQALQANEQAIFEKGIENLGNKSESVRLGGIYNLYDLALGKPERTRNIIDILCAHLRAKTNEKKYRKDHKNKPSNEIQSLLDILAGKKSKKLHNVYRGKFRQEYAVDFTDAFLNGADLVRAKLNKARLGGSQMQGADLREARMQGAYLGQAQMQKAYLWAVQMQGAQMQGADLREAQMQGADLVGAQMQGADLVGAQMQGAWLGKAQMQGALLGKARMQGAYLWEARMQRARMQGADLREAQMQGAYLGKARMQAANLWKAQMQGAGLGEAQMQGADLREAQMQGANLREAQMQGADLREAQMQGAYLWKARMQGADLEKARMQGAYLREAQMQGAELWKAQLQGASDMEDNRIIAQYEFKKYIDSRTNKDTDKLSTVVFSGGLTEEEMNEIRQAFEEVREYRPEKTKEFDRLLSELISELEQHVGPAADHTVPSAVVTGTLDKETAKQIIADYDWDMA